MMSAVPYVATSDETAFMDQVLHVGDDILIAINVDKVLSEEAQTLVNQLIEDNQ